MKVRKTGIRICTFSIHKFIIHISHLLPNWNIAKWFHYQMFVYFHKLLIYHALSVSLHSLISDECEFEFEMHNVHSPSTSKHRSHEISFIHRNHHVDFIIRNRFQLFFNWFSSRNQMFALNDTVSPCGRRIETEHYDDWVESWNQLWGHSIKSKFSVPFQMTALSVNRIYFRIV